MPINYKNYDPSWKTEIRPRILARDKNCCKVCKVPNGTIGYRGKDGKFYSWELIDAALEERGYDYFNHELKHCYDKQGNPTKPTKIVLTVMHLDHNPQNNEDNNLAAACQYHHLIYDIEHHKKNARQTRDNKKGFQKLF